MSLDGQRLGRVGVALLLLLVIAAGVGSDIGGGSATSPRWLGLSVVVLAALAALAGVLVGVSAGAYSAFVGTSSRGKALILGAGATMFAGVVTTLWLLRPAYNWTASGHDKPCLDGVFFWLHFPSRRAELFQDDSGRFCWSSGSGGAADAAGAGGGDIPGGLIAAAGGILVLVIVLATVAAIVARRSRRRAAAPVAGTDPVMDALDLSLDDLHRERDVRRAIIACYARMERALAGSGRGRRAHETPLEFLWRVLEQVAWEPGQVLTELFERARFSVEPMGETEKRSAIAALEQLRARGAG